MSGQEPPAGSGPGAAAPGGTTPGGTAPDEAAPEDGSAEETEERDQPQNAWSARRDLVDHSPRTMKVGAHSRFGGGYAAGDQHGVSGGRVTGDVVMGSKTVHHWSFPGLSTAAASASGEIPRRTLERLAASFVTAGDTFDGLVERLRRERVLVLSGARFTGRRTAALMLLHRLGATPCWRWTVTPHPVPSPTGSPPATTPPTPRTRSRAMSAPADTSCATSRPAAATPCARPICSAPRTGSPSRTRTR
ncbi:hypothetical protein SHKM778_08540 [Streptomyces sp. KM77-8]|uniref:Uncharacterized protein n=1 Tax=Streptomyces haneummycinicus TaxID=3074435 RepID=A0AAT9HAR8_9ACTN